MKVWKIGDGRLVASVPIPGTDPIALAWSPDGRSLFATARNQTLRFEFTTSEAECHGPVSAGLQRAVAFSPAGTSIVGLVETPGRSDQWQGALIEGSMHSNASTFRSLPGMAGFGFAGLNMNRVNGRCAISRPGAGLTLLAGSRTGQDVSLSNEATRCPCTSPDGATLWAVHDGQNVTAWNANTDELLGAWNNSFLAKTFSGLTDIDALAAGNGWVAAGGRDGTIHFVSLKMERLESFARPGDTVSALALSPDESLLVAGSGSGELRLVRVADRTELPAFGVHRRGVTAAAFDCHGSLLATGGKDRTIRIWKCKGDQFELLVAITDLPSQVVSLEFSPQSNELLVLLTNERSARVWNLDKLQAELNELSLGW